MKFTREELEAIALELIPTLDYYDLLDSIDGATDEALYQIIEENTE